MSETHINAYFADVDEAAEEVKQANARYNAARARLEAKKKEVNWQEPEAEQSVEVKEPKQKSGEAKPHNLLKRR